MAKTFEPIRRWEKNPVFWRTESGEVLGFQCKINYESQTMTISDGEIDGKRYTARYGVVENGEFRSLCYHHEDTSRMNSEARYYVELEE